MSSYDNPSSFLDGLGLRQDVEDPNELSNEQLDRIALDSTWIMALAKAINGLYRTYSGPELQGELIRLITRYDLHRDRSFKVLNDRLLDALRWSVKPTQTGLMDKPK